MYIYIYIFINLHTYIPICLYAYIPIYLYTYIPIYLYTYMPIYLYTFIPIYLYNYIPIYLYTYIYIYIYTWLCSTTRVCAVEHESSHVCVCLSRVRLFTERLYAICVCLCAMCIDDAMDITYTYVSMSRTSAWVFVCVHGSIDICMCPCLHAKLI